MIRVLHVVENFNGQAVESWLTRLVTSEEFKKSNSQFDFFLLGRGEGAHAGTVLAKGCKIHLGNPGGASIPQMAKSLRKQVRCGSYDVVHIHQDVLSGIFALALFGTGVKIVTHLHNCWQRLPVGGRAKERILTATAVRLTLAFSNAIVGVSRQALHKLTHNKTRNSRLDCVIYCSAKVQGIAKSETERVSIAESVRASCGLPSSARIVLFLGRLDEYKNPLFALDVFTEMLKQSNADAYLLIAGVGGLEQELTDRVQMKGIECRVRILGWVDIPERLLVAADVLVMPSQEWYGEGLGLAAVEAQGCGVPALCSFSIPEDAEIIPSLFKRMRLSAGAAAWAREAHDLSMLDRQGIAFCQTELQQSRFSDGQSLRALTELYERCLS